jgi:hypothetical protein
MLDGKAGGVNDLARKILQVAPEDHSVDLAPGAGQIAGTLEQRNTAG